MSYRSANEIPCNTNICLLQHSYMFRSLIGTIIRLWHNNVLSQTRAEKSMRFL